jgi:hypothetical protein
MVPFGYKLKNSECAVLSQVPKTITKSAIGFVLRGNLLSKTQCFYLSQAKFVWEVPLGCHQT